MAITASTRLTIMPVYPCMPAQDLDRAKAFYEDTLGMVVFDEEADGFFVGAGSGTRMLVYRSDMARPAGNTAAIWHVDALKPLMSELRSRGVTFEEYDLPGLKTVDGVAEDGDAAAAWFRDSEGNVINLAQRK